MIRRRVLALIPLASAAAVATLKSANASGNAEKTTARFKVSGFTCITCAVGLETLLQREDGVLAVKATYPAGLLTVTFNPKTITEAVIVSSVEEMGFIAELLKS